MKTDLTEARVQVSYNMNMDPCQSRVWRRYLRKRTLITPGEL